VNSDGLTTTVQPQAKAGPTFRVIIANGKFHGVIAPTTPTGCFRTNSLRSDRVGGMISPYIRFASSAKYSIKFAP